MRAMGKCHCKARPIGGWSPALALPLSPRRWGEGGEPRTKVHGEQGEGGACGNRPLTRFVATFVGQLNTLPEARFGPNRAIRPELISLAPRPDTDITLQGAIADVGFLGSVIRLRVDVDGTPINIDTFNGNTAAPPQRGDSVTLHLASRDVLTLGA